MTEKPLETIGDVNAALKHLGWETVDDLHCWAISNDIERFEQLVQAFATHRTEAVAALEARVRELEGVNARLKEQAYCDSCGTSPVRDQLDGEWLCQSCCNDWVKGEGS